MAERRLRYGWIWPAFLAAMFVGAGLLWGGAGVWRSVGLLLLLLPAGILLLLLLIYYKRQRREPAG